MGIAECLLGTATVLGAQRLRKPSVHSKGDILPRDDQDDPPIDRRDAEVVDEAAIMNDAIHAQQHRAVAEEVTYFDDKYRNEFWDRQSTLNFVSSLPPIYTWACKYLDLDPARPLLDEVTLSS